MARKKKKRTKKNRPRLPKMVIPSRPRRPVVLNEGKRYLEQAQAYPIDRCYVGADWQERGITTVVVSRLLPNGKVLAGFYLVDLYCLGVKDAYWRLLSSKRALERHLQEIGRGHEGGLVECSPAFAHEMIYGALEFAARYDLHPHRDFEEARLLLDPPDAHPRSGEITFGKDGQPFYVAGPYDTWSFISQTMATLRRTAKEDFLYLIPVSEDDLFVKGFPVDEEDEDAPDGWIG